MDLELVQQSGWWHRRGFHAQDWTTIKDAYRHDVYHVMDQRPARFDEVVVDVGACIGAFTRRAYERNPAARIFAVEAHPLNIPCLEKNAGGFATIVHAAMTHLAEPALLGSIYEGTMATGGSTVVARAEAAAYRGETYRYDSDAPPPPAITLDELVAAHRIDFIDVLKLDCEGSEYGILENAACLGDADHPSRVGLIVGEYHGGRGRFQDLLFDRFPAERWWTKTWDHHEHMGLFWIASRERPPWLQE